MALTIGIYLDGQHNMPTSLQPMDTSSANYLYCPKTTNTPITGLAWQVSFWIYDLSNIQYVLYTDDTIPITIMNNAGHLQVSDGTNYSDTVLTVTGGYTHILISKTSSGVITVKQNKVLMTTTGAGINSNAVFGNSNIYLMRGGASIYDLRIKSGTGSVASWEYYYDDIALGGDRFLPPG